MFRYLGIYCPSFERFFKNWSEFDKILARVLLRYDVAVFELAYYAPPP